MADPLSKITRRWFEEQFPEATSVQKGTWAAAAAGHHVLSLAPTGSGKTLAAFMVALDRLFNGELSEPGTKVLYISPLKALGTDIRENLSGPLVQLRRAFESQSGESPEIRIGIRNGDTTPAERRRQLKKAPDILVTTPESLNILLLSDGGRNLLSTVKICILDEIHAIAPNRRGTLLACALERLVEIAGEFQRIGLTATVRPAERAAAFLGGFSGIDDRGNPVPRKVDIVAPEVEKEIHIELETLPKAPDDNGRDPDGFWRDIADRLREDMRNRRSTLAFVDSRKWSEKVARLINNGEEELLAWAHHGSLSKDMRRLVERRLKNGELKAVVATGSLELGIDIGPLEEVALIGAPASPSSALQRAGRAGHRPSEPSNARIYPITPGDLLASTVLVNMALRGDIEEIRIPENPLDVLAQVLLALCCGQGRPVDELWSVVRQSWPYRNLPRESFDAVIAMLRGRYAETRITALKPQLYKESGLLIARPGTRLKLFSGGAIPDLGMYSVKARGGGAVIGALDEKFVWESQVGMVFPLGNSRWKILAIGDKDVTVVPTDEAVNTEPFWRAEARSWDGSMAEAIAGILEKADSLIDRECPEETSTALEEYLEENWNLQAESAAELADYLRRQRRRSGAGLPHRGHIVAEAAADPAAGLDGESRSLFLHTFAGGRVNRPLALALQAAWSERSPIPAVPTITDESIVFSLPERDVEDFVSLLYSITDPEGLLREVLEATPFFGGRFRESAGRALLLPSSTPRRRQPLWMTRQRSRMLMEAVLPYPDFPIMSEVWRSCLVDEFDLEALKVFLDDLRSGSRVISIVRTPAPSPFAESAVRRRLAQRMTANMRDQADSRIVSGLESEEIRRLTRSGILRPAIPEYLIRRLDRRRRRVEEGYAPSSPEAFKAWIEEREAFDPDDWKETLRAVAREWQIGEEETLTTVIDTVVKIELGIRKVPWIVAGEHAEEWQRAFASETIDNSAEAARLVAFWMSGRGPKKLREVLKIFGFSNGSSESEGLIRAITEMENEDLVLDSISEDPTELEIADPEALEILLRWRRRQTRNIEAPLPASRLPGFVAGRQGLTSHDRNAENLEWVLNLLEGFSAPAGSWERSIFPVRLSRYKPGDLDALVRREDVLWVGSGERRITWLTAEGGWRFPKPEGSGIGGVFPSPGEAPRGFWDIVESLELQSADAVTAVWQEVWTGRLTADSSEVLRKGVAAGFKAEPASRGGRRRPGGIRGWSAGRPVDGRWYAPLYAEDPSDPFESDQLLRERVRILLRRYGILSKPLLEREIPAFRWSALSRTLNLMELGDEVIGGQWFEGLPMPQYLDPELLPVWRAGAEIDQSWCLEATDPASLCGISGLSKLPPRREGHWLGWSKTGELEFSLSPGKKSLEIWGNPDAEGLAAIARILTERTVDPLSRLSVREVNGGEPDRTGMKLLEQAGFAFDGAGEWIRRPQPIGLR